VTGCLCPPQIPMLKSLPTAPRMGAYLEIRDVTVKMRSYRSSVELTPTPVGPQRTAGNVGQRFAHEEKG
jgi:hypothetical protein